MSHAENQKEKTNNARQEGLLVATIVECLKENGGVVDRQLVLPYVAFVIGLTEEEYEAKHEAESGIEKNYFQSAVDFTLTDMKNGIYGEDYQIVLDDGVWSLTGVENVSTPKVRELAKRHVLAKNAKDLRKLLKQQVSDYYYALSEVEKASFKQKGINSDKLVEYIIQTNSTIEEAFNI